MSEVGRRGPIAWMARNGVTANLLMLIMLAGGFVSSLQLKKEVFPEYSLDRVSINVAYPGASPTDVEQGIVLAVEEALQGIDGIDELRSTASEGSGQVIAELEEGADANAVFVDIQQAVARITSIPADAEKPVISLARRVRSVLSILLHGDADELALREMAESVHDQLLAADGITQVELEGARDYRVHVDVPSAQLQAHGLTLRGIADRLAAAAVDAGGGRLDTAAGEVLVRVAERRNNAREFADLPILSEASGVSLRLGEIAQVRDGFDETQNRSAWFEGQRAIGLEVFRIGDQTPTGVSQSARDALAGIRATLPDGIGLVVLNDESGIYQQRLNLMLKNGFLGLLVVFALMTLFLEFKLAFWVTMGIPVSFLGAMLFLSGTDASINMISMFAFIISLGIVVDDAVVAGENIYEYRQRGMNFLDAAIAGARDIAVPVTFSILTNIAAFLPLMFVPGVMGKLFIVIPTVVCTVFAVSLVEALFILPAHLASSRPLSRESRLRQWQQRFSAGFTRWVETRYQPLIEAAVAHRYLTVTIGVAVLMVGMAYAASGRMGFEMMPSLESDFSEANLALPVGAPAARVRAAALRLEGAARAVVADNGGDAISQGIYTVIDGHRVRTRIYLAEAGKRPISTAAVTEQWRAATPPIADAQSLRFASDTGGPGSGPALTVELSHRDVAVLDDASARLAQALAGFSQVSDIDDGFQPGKAQFNVRLSPAGKSLGLSAREVAGQIRASFYGAEVLRQQRGRNELRVLVRLPEAERNRVADIDELLIRTPSGADVPLDLVAEVERGRAFDAITRRDGRRTVVVTGNVEPRSAAGQVLATVQAQILPSLQRDYPGLSFSFEGQQAALRESLGALGAGFLVALGLVYLLLAIPFGSYLQPVIVMLAIPFGIFGAIVGHLIMGYSMSIISLMGLIALSGVVVNDSLVMVHHANQLRGLGEGPRLAIVRAGARRFRPILLTTLSTFGGLAPMIFETSRQARFIIPMAVSLGYGILFATAITLILVPCIYLIVEDLRALIPWGSRASVEAG